MGDAAVERSDVCAVPAAAVVAEAMVALVLADALLEKVGGDSMTEVTRNFDGYVTYLGEPGIRRAMTFAVQVRRLVLVGFMGSGKSTVGPLLAARLGWGFVDVDATLETEEGASVAEIFRTKGEAYFREAEVRVATRVLERDRIVVGSGGGWGASAGRLRALPRGTIERVAEGLRRRRP